MIRLQQVSKRFGRRAALQDVSLQVERGELYGLLGHNGAGKSTAFGVLLGQVRQDRGKATIRGHDVQRDRTMALSRVGAIFETPAFYGYLSGWHNLRILSGFSEEVPAARIEEVTELVGLRERIHDPVRVYSHGMRQRLGLAQALLPDPEVLLLDEPSDGLDPEGIHEMRGLIKSLCRHHGMTVLLSSHLLAEVEQLCDRVAILREGQLLFEGEWSRVAGKGKSVRLQLDDWQAAEEILGERLVQRSGSDVQLREGVDVSEIVRDLVQAGIEVSAVEPRQRGLEDIYLEVTRGG